MTSTITQPAPRRVHLIRHGETNWNHERRAQGQQESVLTEDGKAQARALAAKLIAVPIEEVYCSSSQRTRQTTELLFGQRGITVAYCDLLREIHMGSWEGSLYRDIEAQHPEQFRAFWHEPHRFRVDGAETFSELQQRAVTRFLDILESSKAQHIAIVSHGAWIKALLCHIEARPLAGLWQPPAMHNCAHSVVEVLADGSQHIRVYANQPYPVTVAAAPV